MENDDNINVMKVYNQYKGSPRKILDYFKENWLNYVVMAALVYGGFLWGYAIANNNCHNSCNDFIHEEILNVEVRECLRQYGYTFFTHEWIDIDYNREPAESKAINWSGKIGGIE